MPYKDLTFLLFAKDMSASRGFEKVAASGDLMAAGVSGAMATAGVAVAGLAIAGAAASVKMAANFQTATTRLVTDAGESKKNLGLVSDGILNISESVGTSATDIAKGMYYVESAGYHAADGLKVMRAAAEGAKIGGANLTTVTDALTTVMKDYAIPAGRANQTTSELIATVSRGKTTMEDLAGSLHSVLPNAQALGIGLNQVLGAVASMTQEGISADQATQNLNHTIVSLANPTHVQAQEMAAMGLNATKVAQQLGKKGLTGTLEELVGAITSHMGKAGLVLQNEFTHSALAAQSADTMFKALPGAVQATAASFEKGSISQKTWTAAVKAMSPENAALAKQWAATRLQADGFSQALRSGSGPAQTFTAALSKMTGGQTGLQVALHLSGVHAKDFKDNVDQIGKSAQGAQKHVHDWATTQATFNQKMDESNAAFGKAGIRIGTALMPALEEILPVLPRIAHGFEVAAPAIAVVADVFAKLVQTSPVVMLGDVSDAIKGLNNPTKLLSEAMSGKFGPAFQIATQAGHAFGSTLRDVAGNVVHAQLQIVGTIEQMKRNVIGTLSSLPKELHTIGANLIEGLVSGVESRIGAVISTISSLASDAVGTMRSILGIHSPSTVFREIGAYVGKGLEQGLLGSVGQIQSASGRLATTIMNSFKSGDISRGAEKAALRSVDVMTNRLQALSRQRATVESQLKATQSDLAEQRQNRAGLISDTRTSTVGAAGIMGFAAPGDAVQGLQAMLSNTRRFKTDLTKLSKAGIDQATFGELVTGWQQDPNSALTAADQLLANPIDMKEIASLQRQLGSAAGSLATFAGNTEYNNAIRSDQRRVSHLTGEDRVLGWEMQHAAERGLNRAAAETHVHIHLNGTYTGTKDELAKTIKQVMDDARKKGFIPKNWATA